MCVVVGIVTVGHELHIHVLSLQYNKLRSLPERRQAQIHGDFTQITAEPTATDTSARTDYSHHAKATEKHSQHHPRTRLSELHTCTKAKCWASVDSTAFTGASVTPSMEWQNLSPENSTQKVQSDAMKQRRTGAT